MLVLSRKTEGSILIGQGISVVVLEIQGNRVRLGIQAPDYTPILRLECGEVNTQTDICDFAQSQ